MNPVIKPPTSNLKPHKQRAFTLTELLVVILVITVLVGILIPVVSTMQKAAKNAASQATLTALTTAIEAYYSDFKAYPGPLTDQEIYSDPGAGPAITLAGGGGLPNDDHITGTENLVLGIAGGLRRDATGIIYDRNALDTARGAGSLNTAQPKLYRSYIATASLYKGLANFTDDAGAALDSPIPEFVDSFNSPLPFLYLRAGRGKPANAANNVIELTTGTGVATTPYDRRYIVGYVGTGPANAGTGTTPIGVGKDLPEYYQDGVARSERLVTPYHGLRSVTPASPAPQSLNVGGAAYNLPFDAYTYFCDPGTAAQPILSQRARKNDSYILISAGKDRVYGTDDDITNFGSVSP